MSATIHELTLSNFKAFGPEPQTVPMSKINLIYGPNSGGKTSLVQSLLLMKQTLEEGQHPATLVPTGRYIDLGNFRTMVHMHNVLHPIDIGFKFSASRRRTGTWEVKMTFERGQGDVPVLTRFKHHYTTSGTSASTEEHHWELIYDPEHTSGRKYQLIKDTPVKGIDIRKAAAWISGNQGRDHRRDLSEIVIGRENELGYLANKLREQIAVWSYRNRLFPTVPLRINRSQSQDEYTQQCLVLSSELSKQVGRFSRHFGNVFAQEMSYLGPVLNPPQRYYRNLGGRQPSVGIMGEYAFDIIANNAETRNVINKYFAQFEIGYELDNPNSSSAISRQLGNPVNVPLLRHKGTNALHTPADVGFGISQILPVIVEAVSGSAWVVCVDQPEIHLHPRLQAQIADLLVDTCNRKQWIVETHSELLARRIQRRIAEGTITPDDVSIVYVDPDEYSSVIKILEIDDDGDWADEWPAGFFEDGYAEMRAKDLAGV